MSFAEYLNRWIKNNNALFEAKKGTAAPETESDKETEEGASEEKKEETNDLSDIVTIIKEQIGGDINDADARNTSFQAIDRP